MRAINLAVKFLLELVAVAAFAYWGATIGSGIVPVLLGVITPLLATVLWGRLAAPRASRRLRLRRRVPFELTVFALAALALLRASSAAAIAFAAVVIVNTTLLTMLGQWDA